MTAPLVTLLCVTKNEFNFPYRLAREQTYQNIELLFVHEDPIPDDQCEFDTWDKARAVQVSKSPKRSLGELYNIGVDAAKGELCAIWDSDDWSSRSRINNQVQDYLKARFPNCLGSWGIYDKVTGKAYRSFVRSWEGSLLCPTELLREYRYSDKYRGCDTDLMNKLIRNVGVFRDNYRWHDMVYVAHENNTCGRAHMEKLMARSMRMPEPVEKLFKERVDGRSFI